MKHKNIEIIVVIISLILLSPLMKAHASPYNITVTMNPTYDSVHAGDEVTVTAIIDYLGALDMVILANLAYYVNDIMQTFKTSNEPLSTGREAYTWTIGPFDYEDEVSFSVILKYSLVSPDYSEYTTFTVLVGDETNGNGDDNDNGFINESNTIVIYAILGGITIIAVVAIIIKTKKR